MPRWIDNARGWITKRRAIGAAIVVLVACLIYGLIPLLICDWLATKSDGQQRAILWLQTFAGNWSADALEKGLVGDKVSMPADPPNMAGGEQSAYPIISRFEFSLLAMIGITLNNFLVIAIMGMIWSVSVYWRRAMNIADAFLVKDRFVKEAFRSTAGDLLRSAESSPSVDQLATALDQAYDKGTSAFARHLPRLVGKSEARNILNYMIRSGKESASLKASA